MREGSLLPVILCGGQGTRLWPLSRASFPKQYLRISLENNHSLLQKTQARLKGLSNLIEPICICNEEHRFLVAEQMRQINVKPSAILLEPVGRNTAPAIAIAALKAIENGQNPMLLVLAADHEVLNSDEFIRTIEAGKSYAEQGRLVTFGIVPTTPETGYGYIEAEEPLIQEGLKGSNIKKFIEKPTIETAKVFIKDDRFTWNSGMFLFQASTILEELKKFAPKILSSCQAALKENMVDLDFQRIEKKAFEESPNISIDIAVMEKTSLGTVLPLNAGWSDIGNWKSIWNLAKKDIDGNAIKGNVIMKNSKNCYIRSENRLIATLGTKDLIIVETNDSILIADHDHSQDVKLIVQELNREGKTEGKSHREIYRPWGHYTSVVEGNRWQVKRIEVKPGATLSLQMHHHRAEHWIVVKGTAQVEINNKEHLLSENQSTFIPVGSKHRLSNPGKLPLVLIEVQSGSYLGEDDIIRFEDKYGRVNKKPSN